MVAQAYNPSTLEGEVGGSQTSRPASATWGNLEKNQRMKLNRRPQFAFLKCTAIVLNPWEGLLHLKYGPYHISGLVCRDTMQLDSSWDSLPAVSWGPGSGLSPFMFV